MPRVGPSEGVGGFMPEASFGAEGAAPGTFSFRLGFGAGDEGLVIASIRNHSVGVFF